METLLIEKDIAIFYVTAKSYPEGILEAHNALHALVPFSVGREYFGLSRPENGSAIVYKAGTEEKEPGEAETYHCESMTIKKGKYISLPVKNFRKDPFGIEKAFQKLLSRPDLDPQGYCLEWYSNDKEEVKCMIRLKDN